MTAAAPRVVWSLDFELRWGMHDRLGLDRDAYRRNLEGAREAVPQILSLFAARGVRCTWATVGALACRDWSDYFRRAPAPPRYVNPSLAVDPRYADMDPDGVLHFAPDLVRQVAATPGQELGSHTFSHLFLGEMGVMRRDAEADHRALTQAFDGLLGARVTSLVFPRNQVAFLRMFRAQGITAWRTTEASWYHRLTQHAEHTLVRAARLADALNPLRRRGGRFTGGGTASTLFVRVTLPEPAWRAHLAKIATEARRARPGDVLHFWLHPHNVGGDVPRGRRRLEQVLDTLAAKAPKGTVYANMGDLAAGAPSAAPAA